MVEACPVQTSRGGGGGWHPLPLFFWLDDSHFFELHLLASRNLITFCHCFLISKKPKDKVTCRPPSSHCTRDSHWHRSEGRLSVTEAAADKGDRCCWFMLFPLLCGWKPQEMLFEMPSKLMVSYVNIKLKANYTLQLISYTVFDFHPLALTFSYCVIVWETCVSKGLTRVMSFQ